MSFKPEYVLLIMTSTMIDYWAGLKMGKIEEKVKRKKYLYLSLITNLGLLFAFKYANFFSDTVRSIFKIFSLQINLPHFDLIFPIGISFYTFQTLSYTIDVYKGKIKPERHLGIFAVFVSFFPQLVAGPIERAKNLIPQFYEKHSFDFNRTISGLRIIIWGLILKMVVADRLAIIVNKVYGDVNLFTGLQLIIATLFFGIQLYGDFAGYSYIAIGTAKILGFNLMENFKRPFFAKTFSDLWKRWHISLTSWFQDYVFIPLYWRLSKLKKFQKISVRSRHNLAFIITNLIAVTLLGLWHGASWNFVLFGLYYGILASFYHLIANKWIKLKPILQNIILMTSTYIGIIFFRANSREDAFYVIKNFLKNSDLTIFNSLLKIGTKEQLIISFSAVLFLFIVEWIMEKYDTKTIFFKIPIGLRWMIYYLFIFILLLFGNFFPSEFIYFRF